MKPRWLTPVSMFTPAQPADASVNMKSSTQRAAASVSLTPGLPPPENEFVSQMRYGNPGRLRRGPQCRENRSKLRIGVKKLLDRAGRIFSLAIVVVGQELDVLAFVSCQTS